MENEDIKKPLSQGCFTNWCRYPESTDPLYTILQSLILKASLILHFIIWHHFTLDF